MRLHIAALAIVLVACTRASTAPTPSYPSSYDIVISGGKIVDGTGNPWMYGDIGIKNGRIARMTPRGMLARVPATRRIDATGLVVAPGVIDIQAHSEEQLLYGDSRVMGMTTQGVTTMIMGEGETPGQMSQTMFNDYLKSGDTTYASLYRSFIGPTGFGVWLEAMQRHAASVNFGSFLGAGAIRQYAKNMAEGTPTPAEVDTMRTVVRQGMRDGAFGVASALIYPPGNYAGTEELIEEAKAMAPYGGVYITHMRSEGDRLIEALQEAMRIGREGNVPVEIYHLKAAGVKNWPKMKTVLAMIDSARAAGQDITVDQYPYTAGSNNLSSCIPPWAHADGKLLDRLRDPTSRAKIKTEMMDENANFESLCLSATAQGAGDRECVEGGLGRRLDRPDVGRAEPARSGDLHRVGLEHRGAGQEAVHEVRDGRRRLRSGQHDDRRASALVRHVSADPRPVCPGLELAHARGCGAQDDRRDRGSAVDSRSR
jgi:N-acyl-D-amino-acid deacylase